MWYLDVNAALALTKCLVLRWYKMEDRIKLFLFLFASKENYEVSVYDHVFFHQVTKNKAMNVKLFCIKTNKFYIHYGPHSLKYKHPERPS